MSILLSLIEYPFDMIGLSRYSDCLGNLLTFVPIIISTNGTLTHTIMMACRLQLGGKFLQDLMCCAGRSPASALSPLSLGVELA